MAYLRVVQGPGTGRHLEVKEPKCVFGRHPDCDISVDLLDASRHHAQIVTVNAEHFLEDLHSRNGTWLNDRRVQGRQRLKISDRFRVSEMIFEYQAGAVNEDHSSTSVSIEEHDLPEDIYVVAGKDSPSERSGSRNPAMLRAEIEALLEITQALRKTLALDEVLPLVLDSLFKIFPSAERGFIILKSDDGQLVPRWVKLADPACREARVSSTIIQRVLDSQQAILSADAAGDFRFKSSESLNMAPIRSVICAPLVDADGQSFGVLQVDTVSNRRRFKEQDLHVLVSVATQASISIENARLYERALKQRDIERDLELADQIQRSFLPKKLPEVPGYQFFDHYKPASHVGGDFYDYVFLPSGKLAIVVADVAGHGLAAAMLTAKLAAELKYHLLTVERPAEVVRRLNSVVPQDIGDQQPFITLVLVLLDPTSGKAVVVNAGHIPPVLRSPQGTAAEIGKEQSTLPLGLLDAAEPPEVCLTLEPGSVLALATDGIVEASNAEKGLFGIPRLIRRVERAGANVTVAGPAIIDSLAKFIGDGPQHDDVCLVCVGRKATG